MGANRRRDGVSGDRPPDSLHVGAVTDQIGRIRAHGGDEELSEWSAEHRRQAPEELGVGDLDLVPLNLRYPATDRLTS